MEETLVKEQGSAVADPKVLNKDTATTLTSMLKSKDEGDHKMAQLILNQVDVEKSIYWIWKITRDIHWQTNNMVNLRTKASRKFRDDTNLFAIANKNAGEFSKWLLDKQWMTPEIYSYLRADIVADIQYKVKGFSSCKMFDFTIELKEEYKHLDPNDARHNLYYTWKTE